jgi:hypothetical protein
MAGPYLGRPFGRHPIEATDVSSLNARLIVGNRARHSFPRADDSASVTKCGPSADKGVEKVSDSRVPPDEVTPDGQQTQGIAQLKSGTKYEQQPSRVIRGEPFLSKDRPWQRD